MQSEILIYQTEDGQTKIQTRLENETVWLSTAFHTRAEQFYRKAGWKEVGLHGTKEIKFEMTMADWMQHHRS